MRSSDALGISTMRRARAGDEVLALAGVLEECDGRLARLAEVEDRVVHLLHLGPVRRLEAGGQDDDALDARVHLRLAQRLEDAAQAARLIPLEQLLHDVVVRHFSQVVVQAEDERGVAGDGGAPPDSEVHEHHARDGNEDRQER